jgi:hypothetical protein
MIEPNRVWVESARQRMTEAPYELDSERRKIVLSGMLRACDRRGWRPVAAHVRSTHVHAVVIANASAERVLIGLKAFATRALKWSGVDQKRQHFWAYHGSTLYLWDHSQVESAIQYVLEAQGESMEVYANIEAKW